MASLTLSPITASSIAAAPAKVNLVPHSEDISQWKKIGANVSGPLNLNADGRFTGYAVTSTSSEWQRVNSLEIPAQANEVFSVRLYLRQGTSGTVRIMARYAGTVISSDNLVGPLATLPSAAGNMVVVSNSLLSDGVSRELVLRITMPRDTNFQFDVGANSADPTKTVIILAAHIERGATPSAYQKTP